MTETIFSRRPYCVEILSNFEKYNLVIGELIIEFELAEMTNISLAKLPADSIIHQYLENVLRISNERLGEVLSEKFQNSPAPMKRI